MANAEALMERLRRETEAGLRERLAVAEALVEDLHQALFTEVRERLSMALPSDEAVWDYIEANYGVGRVKEPV